MQAHAASLDALVYNLRCDMFEDTTTSATIELPHGEVRVLFANRRDDRTMAFVVKPSHGLTLRVHVDTLHTTVHLHPHQGDYPQPLVLRLDACLEQMRVLCALDADRRGPQPPRGHHHPHPQGQHPTRATATPGG